MGDRGERERDPRRLKRGMSASATGAAWRKKLTVQSDIRFDDGAAYERMMGAWSRLAGDVFIDWLMPEPGLRWVDVGCGNGAFSELLVQRCAPAQVQGIDPSDRQLAFARTRPAACVAEFRRGDAMALPFAERSFDVAVMALVIFFVPDPAKGVAEMVRVVSAGGIVTAYAWDVMAGGLPMEPLHAQMRAMGIAVPMPPSPGASRIDTLRELWLGAGLEAVETREITVERTFADFEDFWTTTLLSQPRLDMTSAQIERLERGVRERVSPDAAGRVTTSGRANAIKGRVPR